ncbi:MAG: hypothetical protein ABI333_08530 [bacterium]
MGMKQNSAISTVIGLGLSGALAGLLLLSSGCDPVKCGEGTREADGLCVPLNPVADGGPHCGWGTLEVSNTCVPDPEICGAFTEVVPELDANGDPTGIFVCEGHADATDIEPPPSCEDEPFGQAGEICINGWVHWLMDESEGVFMTNIMLDATAPEDATSAVVKVYDPLLYAQDPVNTVPLGIGEVNPRNGTFRVLNIPIPGTGFLALVHDDLNGEVNDDFVLVGVPYLATPSQHLTEVVAFAVTTDQMLQWTDAVGGDAMLQSINCPEPEGGGERTLSSCGTWIGVFMQKRPDEGITHVEGVTPLYPGGLIPEDRTFYPGIDSDGSFVFDDPTPGVVWTDDQGPHEWTGRLGAAFYPTASLGNMSGQCSQGTPCSDQACLYAEVLGGAINSALFVQWMIPVISCEPLVAE